MLNSNNQTVNYQRQSKKHQLNKQEENRQLANGRINP